MIRHAAAETAVEPRYSWTCHEADVWLQLAAVYLAASQVLLLSQGRALNATFTQDLPAANTWMEMFSMVCIMHSIMPQPCWQQMMLPWPGFSS